MWRSSARGNLQAPSIIMLAKVSTPYVLLFILSLPQKLLIYVFLSTPYMIHRHGVVVVLTQS